jgi:hypothetical protein
MGEFTMSYKPPKKMQKQETYAGDDEKRKGILNTTNFGCRGSNPGLLGDEHSIRDYQVAQPCAVHHARLYGWVYENGTAVEPEKVGVRGFIEAAKTKWRKEANSVNLWKGWSAKIGGVEGRRRADVLRASREWDSSSEH